MSDGAAMKLVIVVGFIVAAYVTYIFVWLYFDVRAYSRLRRKWNEVMGFKESRYHGRKF